MRISIIIPCYNESQNITAFYRQLKLILDKESILYELVYVNDGSTDQTLGELYALTKTDKHIKIIDLSRNFGKEIALSAGIRYATGDALLMIDGDGQNPPEVIPKFIEKWQTGAQVVTGIRDSNQGEGWIKHYGSNMFYWIFNRFTDASLVPQSTDYRLIDRVVQVEFVKLTERNRMTRGLIDWLGFKQEYIHFKGKARMAGVAGYSFSKLVKLALNSSVSLSLTPLYFSAYAGAVILPLSVLLGIFSALEMLVGDPFGLNISGSAYLVILILFLVGLLLVSQGIMALYLSHMHTESQNRPLFVVNHATSRGLPTEE